MSNGTNPENPGQSTTNPEQELTYEQLVAEMEKGASPDLDALMTGTLAPAPEPEPEVETPPEPASPNEKDDKEPKTDDGAQAPEPTTEAAAAASPAKTDAEKIADLERELHRTRSDAGRVPYIQRRMQELERELRASKARPPASTSTDVDPSSIEIPAALKKKYDTIRETDPDLADTLEETFRMQTALVHTAQETAVHTVTQEQQEREDREFFMTEKSKLLQAVPQADAIFALPEWKAWKDSLTPGRKAIASSGYADEMVQAIHAFSVDYQAAKGQPLFQQPAPQAAPAPSAAPAATPEDNAVKAERERKLATSATATAAAAKATVEFDEKKYFEEMYAKLGKDQGIIKTP
jgi:hypothetical protein